MDTAWRIIDCSSFEGTLRSERGAIIVTPSSGAAFSRVPVDDVAVLLVGPHVEYSTAVMHRLLGADVMVLFCDWRGIPEGAAYPWGINTRVAARQIAQADLSLPRRKNAWGRIVRAKIEGQATVLSHLDADGAARLRQIAREVKSGDPNNAEGLAARLYWSRWAEGGSFTRDQDSEDGVNSCLNYGYAVLRAQGIRAVTAAGLHPTLGLFHHGRGNYFNLVDDLIEPFRPAIDSTVLSLPDGATPSDREVKRLLVCAATQTFNQDGDSLPTVLERLAQHLAQYVERRRDHLDVPHWSGPNDGR